MAAKQSEMERQVRDTKREMKEYEELWIYETTQKETAHTQITKLEGELK